jgi:ABC-type nitrate/sulfonate/bicarbonate transport system substrate-binding protein
MINKKIWRRLPFLLSIGLLAASASCSPTLATPATVKIVMAPYFGSWLCTYAITNGLVTTNTVNVTIDQSLKFDDQMMAGNYPIGAMSSAAFAIATEKSNIGFKTMGVYVAHSGIQSLNGTAVVYTKNDSTLRSPADLKGKKVGVPGLQSGTTSTFFGLLQSEYGVNESQMTIVDAAPPQLIELLRKGDIDATLLLGDPSVQTFYNPAFKILWNVDKTFRNKYGAYNPASFLAVQSDFLKKNPQVTRAVYDLLKKSRTYGEAHLVELSQKYAVEFGGTAEFYQNAYREHYSVTFDPIQGNLQTGVLAIFGFVKDRGIISKVPAPETMFEKW